MDASFPQVHPWSRTLERLSAETSLTRHPAPRATLCTTFLVTRRIIHANWGGGGISPVRTRRRPNLEGRSGGTPGPRGRIGCLADPAPQKAGSPKRLSHWPTNPTRSFDVADFPFRT